MRKTRKKKGITSSETGNEQRSLFLRKIEGWKLKLIPEMIKQQMYHKPYSSIECPAVKRKWEAEMKENNSMGNCRSCGARILWIRTAAGRNMPVDPAPLGYRKVPGGRERIVTPDGDVITGEKCEAGETPDGYGYMSHFATCPEAGRHRKRR